MFQDKGVEKLNKEIEDLELELNNDPFISNSLNNG